MILQAIARGVLLLATYALTLHAQQPFLTDDADVALPRQFHLELISEYDRLQSLAFPTLRQNTSRLQLTYGLFENLEIGCDGPLISIFNSKAAGVANAFGVGDLDLQIKYRLRHDRDDSVWPAVTIGFYVEVPTGNSKNQLGSGIADYWLNGILQKSITKRITVRLNSGLLFSGNTLTGAIGIQSTRGRVFTGSSSVTYQLTSRLLVGGEVAGAFSRQVELGKAQLQMLGGGKFMLSKSIGLDFALTGGKYEGSPKLGGALGISVDF